MARTSTRLIPCLVAVALAAGACGGATETATSATDPSPATTVTEVPLAVPVRPAADYAGFRQLPTACGAEQPPERVEMQFAAPEDMNVDPAATLEAVLVTSCGDIVVELTPATAPATVNSFVFLAEAGYFDGTVSHRIAPGFVIQAGDPTATGTGSPGYVIPDEFPPPGFPYERGVLAMANAGAATTGSQFFIVLGATNLGPQFNVFGRVVDGFDVLDAIAAVPLGVNARGEQSAPLEAVYIEDVAIRR